MSLEPAAPATLSSMAELLRRALRGLEAGQGNVVEVQSSLSMDNEVAHALAAALPLENRFVMIRCEAHAVDSLVVLAAGADQVLATAPCSLPSLEEKVGLWASAPVLVHVPFDVERAQGGVFAYIASFCLVQRAGLLRVVLRGERGQRTCASLLHACEHPIAHTPTPLSSTLLVHRPNRDQHASMVNILSKRLTGRVRKVVLARSSSLVGVSHAREHAPSWLHRLHLHDHATTAYLFDVDDTTWMGATPEWLYRRAGDVVVVDVLAGTAPRGATDEEDGARMQALQHSHKDRAENDVVFDELRARLQGKCNHVEELTQLHVLKLRHVQHLRRRLRGRLSSSRCLLSELHPTSAVCGFPRHDALALIRETEPFDRQYYAGVVGIIDGEHEHHAVILRCARITADGTTLFAGGGLMPDSEPSAEWAELDHKMSSLMHVFGGVT
jgi:isochorismate synthase